MNLAKRSLSALLLLCMIISLFSFTVSADSAQPTVYSTEKNSGTRDVIATTLEGTGANAYYTDGYIYDILSKQEPEALLQSLRQLMTDTHTYQSTYDDCRDLASKTDCQNEADNILLLYSSYVATKNDYITITKKGWNREHVWPKARGGFSNSGPGSDLHHIRPTDSSINGQRGHEFYGNAAGGHTVTGTVVTENAAGGTSNGQYFEPFDNVKGDVARICLYLYVRYGGDSKYRCDSITNVFESVDVLLQWCALDPVDTWELGRNEVVGAIQGNRNVFIDYPEYAWLIFGKEVPKDMATPSGKANQADCTHESFSDWVVIKEATTTEEGQIQRQCLSCGLAQTGVTPKLEESTDLTTVWIACGVIALSGGLIGGILISRKKRKSE